MLESPAGPVGASRRSTAAQDRRGSVRGFGRLRGCARGCPSGRNAGATNARVSRAGRSPRRSRPRAASALPSCGASPNGLDGPGAGAASLADAVDAYAESRFRAGASVATVAGDLGAIRWYAGASGIEAAASLGAASLGDAKRDHDRRRRGRGQAAALRWAAADQVARRAARDGTPKGLRDAALVAVASDLCARVSEVAALRVRDVTTAGDGSAAVDVWSVKTGTARTGYLRASTVRRVRAWTDAAGIGNGSPLFPKRKGCRYARSSAATF